MLTGNRYHWTAVYNDGTSLSQHDTNADGQRYAYKDVDRSKLKAFEIWEGNNRILYIKFDKNQRLIWRRRVETTSGGIVEVCHIIGKQENVNGRNYQGIIGLFESDGRLEVAGKFEQGHPWFYPPPLHQEEGEVQ
jgi:hypothetical protein